MMDSCTPCTTTPRLPQEEADARTEAMTSTNKPMPSMGVGEQPPPPMHHHGWNIATTVHHALA